MPNVRQLRLKIDALKQEHAKLPASIGWQSTANLNANLVAYIQALEALPTTASDVDLCGDPQLITFVPYPLSRPILRPGFEQLDMELFIREGVKKGQGTIEFIVANILAATVEVVTGTVAHTVMRLLNPYAGDYYTHWLGGSGAARYVPVHTMLSEISGFREHVQTEFTNMVSKVNDSIAQNIQDSPNSDCHAFLIYPESSTDWHDQKSTGTNWHLAFGEFQYSLGANVLAKRQSDGSWDVQMCYSVFTYDIYDWNVRGEFPDTSLGTLEMIQTAKQFELFGSTQPVCINYIYPNISYPSFQIPTTSIEFLPE